MKELLDISSFLGLPEQASAHAWELDYWTGLIHWLMLLLAVGWGAFFIYTMIRFRSSKNPQANYNGTSGKLAKYQEGGVILAEVLLLAVFAIPNWAVWREAPNAANAVHVHVIGEQFAWNFHYPGADGVFGKRDVNLVDTQFNPLGLDRSDPAAADDLVMLNELHLPVDQNVVLHISSKDVIHSFSMNAHRVKQDAIPGLVIPVGFVPTETGRFEISCAQLCGLSHYRMRAFVYVHTAQEYEQWLIEAAEEMAEYAS
jgi:cytochrome c oxidase subunit 2